jgi:hypothetical protein
VSEAPKQSVDDLSPFQREVHDSIDLGSYTWRDAVWMTLRSRARTLDLVEEIEWNAPRSGY